MDLARATWWSIAARESCCTVVEREIVCPFAHGWAHLPGVYSEDLARLAEVFAPASAWKGKFAQGNSLIIRREGKKTLRGEPRRL